MKNEVLMKSSHKLKNERSKHIQAIEQPLININLNFFINQMKLRYLKSILQSRSSLPPSYCKSLDFKVLDSLSSCSSSIDCDSAHYPFYGFSIIMADSIFGVSGWAPLHKNLDLKVYFCSFYHSFGCAGMDLSNTGLKCQCQWIDVLSIIISQ